MAGEVVRGVRSLTVPDRGRQLGEAAAAGAVRLFVQRASSATDLFLLEDNAGVVVEVMESRMPLAMSWPRPGCGP